MQNRESLFCKVIGTMLAISLLSAIPAVTLAADAYPNKPIRFIIPFAPGGGTDIMGRAIATLLTERLGKQVIVENHGGAGGLLGTELVANARPDGYTLMLVSAAHTFTTAISIANNSKLPYDPTKSFAPVAKIATGTSGLAVYPGLPVKSVKELVALAKEKPGKLILASSGVGSFAHFAGVLFWVMTDTNVVTVQFKGGSTTQTDVIGGHSQIVVTGIVSLLPYVKSGQLRILGVGGKKRSLLLPDVPTISEAGVPGYEATNFFGIFAPAGTPQDIVDRLNKEIITIVALPEVQKLFMSQGAEMDYMGPAEFGKFMEDEAVKWTKVVKVAGIKPE